LPVWEEWWMRVLQFSMYGGPEVLEWAEAPDPHPGPGQIRIAVWAASVNPIDWKTADLPVSAEAMQPPIETATVTASRDRAVRGT
jgi:NADPH:quinone reductase-like Zn-dependent oxidoreductase